MSGDEIGRWRCVRGTCSVMPPYVSACTSWSECGAKTIVEGGLLSVVSDPSIAVLSPVGIVSDDLDA